MTASVLLPELHAGVDALVQRTVEFGRRDTRSPIKLTDRDVAVLAALLELRYLTSTMIAALVWGSYNTRLRVRLLALFNAELVRRFRPRLAHGAGEAQWVYELDRAGYRLLSQRAEGDCPRWKRTDLAAFSYAEHDLECNALLCEIAARAAARHGRSGPLLSCAPFEMHGALTGRLDPTRDGRPADADPSNLLPDGVVVRPGSSFADVVEPDATLSGHHHRTGEGLAVLIEYDRTRKATKLASKLARYDHLVSDGWRRTALARHAHEPTVLFILREERQLGDVLREADRLLTAWVGPSGGQLAHGRFPGREEIGFTTRDWLMAGDDRVLQVQPLPSAAPRRPIPTVETTFPLAALFGPPPLAAT
jgi:hypothetical protein